MEASFTSKATLIVVDPISIIKRDEIALPLKLCNLFDGISVTLAFQPIFSILLGKSLVS